MVLTEGKIQRCGQRDFRGVGTQARVHRFNERHPFDVEILRIPPGEGSLFVSFAQRTVGVLSCDFWERRRPP